MHGVNSADRVNETIRLDAWISHLLMKQEMVYSWKYVVDLL